MCVASRRAYWGGVSVRLFSVFRRRVVAVAAASVSVVVIAAGLVAIAAPAQAATINASQGIVKTAILPSTPLTPGTSFSYRLDFSCGTSITGVTGCDTTTITDLLPEWIDYVGVSSFPGTAAGTVTTSAVGDRTQVVLAFTAAVQTPSASTGLPLGSYQMDIQVRVSPNAPWTIDGTTIPNTANIASANADPKSSTATVTPVVPQTPAATADKSFSPTQNFNTPGLTTTLTLTGTNTTNGPADSLVVQDPAGPGNPPTGATSPFHYLAFTGFGAMTLPAGATGVTAEVYSSLDSQWHTVYTGAGPPVYPATGAPDPADVYGVRFTYTGATAAAIERGAAGVAAIALAQRANVAGLPATTVSNSITASATLGTLTANSPLVSKNYQIVPYGLQVTAAKTFDADQVKAGDPTTVRLGATNAGTVGLRSLSITEPGAATTSPNPLADELTFAGFGQVGTSTTGVQWPDGATSATIVYTYSDNTTSAPLSTTTADTIPAPDVATRVVGFTVTFSSTATGGIVPGAEAKLPFIANTSRPTPLPDRTDVVNAVDVTGVAVDDPSRTATAHAQDTLSIYGDRLGVTVAKTITPGQGYLTAGQQFIAQIPATVAGFPATTVNPTQVVVTDSDALSADWWDLYDATQLTQLGIPGNASLTVQYQTAPGVWTNLPGAIGLTAPPQYRTIDIPSSLSGSITGLRFVYDALSGQSFAPGSTFQPNITFTTRAVTRSSSTPIGSVPTNATIPGPGSGTTDVVQRANCGSADASATSPALSATTANTSPCAVVNLVPLGGGSGTGPDLVDKSLNPIALTERTQATATGTLNWSTGGLTGIAQQYVTETGAAGGPATSASLGTSFFNTFDLTRIAPITKTSDPAIAYDTLAAVELFNGQTGVWTPVTISGATSWDGPTSGSTVFPGYTLSASERSTTTGVRFLFEESPNRASVLTPGSLTQPAVGSGVTATQNRRPITLTFQLRDVLRSDGTTPVLYNDLYNTSTPGQIHNTVTSDACLTDFVAGVCADGFSTTDGADIALLNATATITTTKTWSGGPIGVPPSGTPAADYPSTRATLDVTNNGPQLVNSITATEPSPGVLPGDAAFAGSAFDAFTLTDIAGVTAPQGATATELILTYADGTTSSPYTIAQATALTAADLVNVVGISATSTGRIQPTTSGNTNGRLRIVIDLQLRETYRSDPATAVAAGSVPNTLIGQLADPSIETAGTCADSPVTPSPAPNTVIDCDSAAMQITNTQTRTVTAAKSFAPDSQQYENESDTFTMNIAGTPGGTARSNQVQLTDQSPAFFNAYSFAGLASTFAIASPANRVMVEVLTGGTYAVAPDNSLTLTGGTWQTVVGTASTAWKSAAQARTALPGGTASSTATLAGGGLVTYGAIQGVRFTYQRVAAASVNDPAAALLLFENPATPTLNAAVSIQRRTALVTGGPVPTDLAGNSPAPGTTAAGSFPNSVEARASGVPGNGVDAVDTASATMHFLHLPTEARLVKTPSGTMQPATTFTVGLATTNNGQYPIIDPVITDTLPVGTAVAGAPDYVFPAGVDPTNASSYTFARTGGTAPGAPYTSVPVDPSQVTVHVTYSTGSTPEPIAIRFSFASGTALGLGETYTISFPMRLRPGLLAGQVITNTYSLDGQRQFDQCNLTGPPSDTCSTSAAVSVLPLANLGMYQEVRADDASLGVTSSNSTPCSSADATSDGFYSGHCAPITKPGAVNTWRGQYTNQGTYSLDTVSSILYLPNSGASGITLPSATTEWHPTLSALPTLQAAVAPGATATYYYSSVTPGTALCDDVLNPGGSCPPGYWKPLDSSVDLSTVTAIYAVVDFAGGGHALRPGETFTLSFPTDAPPAAVNSGTNPIAWNSAMTGATYTAGGSSVTLLPFEVPVVGAALASGSITIEKTVTGDAAGESWVPTTFSGSLQCTSNGVSVASASLPTVPALTANVPVTVGGLPWGADCAFVESNSGAASSVSPASITAVSGTTPLQLQTVTNVYDYASLTVSKTVTASTGFPIPTGFGFSVDCTFNGASVLSTTFTLDDGGSRTFTNLPARAHCTVTETDPLSAQSTVTSVDVTNPTVTPTTDQATRTADIPELSPNGAGGATQNAVSFENLYDVAGLTLTKSFEGGGAAQFGETQSFTAHVVCALNGQTLVDTTRTLSASGAWTASVTGILAGSTCDVTENALLGADAVVITPNDGTDTTTGVVTIPTSGLATVALTNWYLTGSVQVTKTFAGAGAATYGTAQFTFDLACTRGGESVVLPGGATRIVDAASPVADYTGIASGSSCILRETDAGGAGLSEIQSATGAPLADAATGYTFTVATDPTVLSVGDQAQPALQVQNTFRLAQVTVTKTVDSQATDATGHPLTYGPFQVALACTFNGAAVAATEPLTQSIAAGGSFTWTGLPEGADCRVTETDAAGAARTTVAVTEGGVTQPAVTGTTATLSPLPDVSAADQSTVAFTNAFDVAPVVISKELSGLGSIGITRTFPVHVVCTYTSTVYPAGVTLRDVTAQIGGTAAATLTISDVPIGTVCDLTETDTGGATATRIHVGTTVTTSASAQITLTGDDSSIVVENEFEPPLAYTGAAMNVLVPIGGGLLLLVGGLLLWVRRRRSA
ncbi:DUF5979 domain-containing protein [Microbacteriaceae bacterium K1510]|nr:DUF5979 domain-containing protein [Microbacteriaceae bacterium K1510]